MSDARVEAALAAFAKATTNEVGRLRRLVTRSASLVAREAGVPVDERAVRELLAQIVHEAMLQDDEWQVLVMRHVPDWVRAVTPARAVTPRGVGGPTAGDEEAGS